MKIDTDKFFDNDADTRTDLLEALHIIDWHISTNDNSEYNKKRMVELLKKYTK